MDIWDISQDLSTTRRLSPDNVLINILFKREKKQHASDEMEQTNKSLEASSQDGPTKPHSA